MRRRACWISPQLPRVRLFSARGGEAAGGAVALVLLPELGDAVEVAAAAKFAEGVHDVE